jgi:hypothetical protein
VTDTRDMQPVVSYLRRAQFAPIDEHPVIIGKLCFGAIDVLKIR